MMIALYFFDWNGPRESVKEYGKILKNASEGTNVKFHGLYNPPQDKWNFVAAFEGENEVVVREGFRKAGGMPEKMTHAIAKYYVKIFP